MPPFTYIVFSVAGIAMIFYARWNVSLGSRSIWWSLVALCCGLSCCAFGFGVIQSWDAYIFLLT